MFRRYNERGDVQVRTSASFRSKVFEHHGFTPMGRKANPDDVEVLRSKLTDAKKQLVAAVEQFTSQGSNWTIEKLDALTLYVSA